MSKGDSGLFNIQKAGISVPLAVTVIVAVLGFGIAMLDRINAARIDVRELNATIQRGFVTKEDFKDLSRQVDQIDGKVDSMNNRLTIMEQVFQDYE